MWFIGIQLFGPDERDAEAKPENIIYSGTFTWEKSDGSSEKISVPGHYDVSPEETMVITTTLPEDFRENTLAIRSSLQDISFYINGELRTKYDTSGHRIFGKNSSSRYVFCATSPEDAGKELRIEIKTHTEKYSGVVNAVYCGDKFDIWEYIYSCYGFETILAFFILFTGIFTIIFSLALGIVYQTKFDMEYLGWCLVLGSIWMLGESKFRQLLVPNSTLLGGLCFVIIMLCPLLVLFYADTIQRGRHRKLYLYIEFISLLNFCVNTILHLTGIADYIETLPVDHGILAIALCAIWATFIYDIKNKITDKNYLVMIGLIIMIIAVAIEAVSSYTTVSLWYYPGNWYDHPAVYKYPANHTVYSPNRSTKAA